MPPSREVLLHTGILLFLLCPVFYFLGERAAFYSFTCGLLLILASFPGYALAYLDGKFSRRK